MADEPSNPYARLWRRAALPEEALTTVKILEEFDYDLYKIALTGGREVYAFSAGREETFEVGKDEKVFRLWDSLVIDHVSPDARLPEDMTYHLLCSLFQRAL